jgi:hypothetical protein
MSQSNQSLESQFEQLNQKLTDFLELQKEASEELNGRLDKICLSFLRLESLIRAEVIGLSTVVAMLVTTFVKIMTLF